MTNNKNLAKAFTNKNDEYYTRLVDIESELSHYKNQFKGKIVLCNCDDPYESNFFKYFAMNFNVLGLKKLISTCYAGSPIITEQLSLFDIKGLVINKKQERNPYKIEITEVNDLNGDGAIDLSDVEYLLKNKKNTLTLLKEDGDFRSDECIELLKEADIVVTNPPFSLFNEYIAQLIEYKKQFLILGNPNSIHYKNIFPLVQNNKIWIGYKTMGSDMYFIIPEKYKQALLKNNKEGSGYKTIDGEIYGRSRAIWFTNLDVSKRHENLILYKKFKENDYCKYENYDAIEISSVSDIPVDYYEKLGVPDNFLEFYNPKQFKIIGYGRGDFIDDIKTVPIKFLDDYHKIGGKGHVTSGMKTLCFYTKEGIPKFPYSRIIVQLMKDEEIEENGN